MDLKLCYGWESSRENTLAKYFCKAIASTITNIMTGGTSVKSKSSETDDEFYQSEDESLKSSANKSRASTKGKKKRSSSAASTSSSTGRRRTGKKKAMGKADDIMSDMIGMTEHSSEGKKKSKVPKKIKKKSKSLGEHFGANSGDESVLDDGVSCLTENSRSTKNSKSTKGTKSTTRSKSRNKKKRSSSKNSSRARTSNPNGSQHSPTEKSVSSRRSKSRSKKGAKNISLTSKHDDDNISKRRPRRTQSLPLNSKTSKGSSSLATKKKANAFGRDGSVKLKILPDGTVKPSVPRRSTSIDKDHIWRKNQVDENSDSDSVSLSDSSDENRIYSRRGRRVPLDRSTSLQHVNDLALVTKRKSRSPVSRSRNRTAPTRMAARGNPANLRTYSADNVRDMQRHLARSHSNQSLQNSRNAGFPNSRKGYVAPSPREAPVRRGVARNSSAPLRSAMRSPAYSGRGPTQQRPPLRSTKSAYFHEPPRRQLSRSNSRNLSTSEHVQILRGFTENFEKNNQEKQNQPCDEEAKHEGANRRRSASSRGLSPTRGIQRNISSRSDCSFSSKESYGRGSLQKYGNKSDLDPGDVESSIAIKQDIEDYASENESLNDNVQVVDFGDMRDRSMSRDRTDRSISRTRSNKLSRTSSEKSFLGVSMRSMQSNRSQMSIDQQEPFQNDPPWKTALRYIHILPPYQNESKLKKKIRIFTWTSMLLDFIAAAVAVIQYQGSTTCCGDSVFDIIMDINWDALFRVVTYMYILMIFAEIIPVVKNGIPFNIVNPAIGLIITFGMFFDDSIAEAVAMWVIEAAAIFFEFMVYRVHARIFFETSFKLKQVDDELEELKKKRKEFIERLREGGVHISMHDSRHGFGSRHSSRHSSVDDLEKGRGRSYDDEDSLSGHSFGADEDFDDELNSSPPRKINRTNSRDFLGPSTHSRGARTNITGITGGKIRLPGEIKQNKLLRRRRLLREHKKQESKDLHYHSIGTVLNVSLAVIAMIFIITIASTGGLCFKSNTINIFSFQQLSRCDRIDISIPKEKYENCEIPDEPQCYLPYY